MKSQINLQNQNAISIYNGNQAQVKIIAKKKCILDDDVIITADNIKKIGELIALLTIRTVTEAIFPSTGSPIDEVLYKNT